MLVKYKLYILNIWFGTTIAHKKGPTNGPISSGKFEVISHGWDDVETPSQNAGRGDDNLTQKTPFSSLQRSEARTDSGSDWYSDCWINSLMERMLIEEDGHVFLLKKMVIFLFLGRGSLIGLPVILLGFQFRNCENCLYLCIILFATVRANCLWWYWEFCRCSWLMFGFLFDLRI